MTIGSPRKVHAKARGVPNRLASVIHVSLSCAALMSAVLTAVLVAAPLASMQFTKEVNGGIGDFVAAAGLLFGAGMACYLAAGSTRTALQRLLVAMLVLAVVGMIWAELAVGWFT
jgi:uncharacterized membrane protein YfcA